jgi:predicted transcriptional regulator
VQCSEIMESDVKIINQNEDVVQAAALMRDAEIGFLPVCDSSDSRIVGTLTDRDIAIRFVAEKSQAKQELRKS